MPHHDIPPSDRAPAGDKQQYEHLYAFVPGMVYRAGPDWSMQVICHSEDLCGYSPDEFESGSVNWLDLIHPDDRTRICERAEHLTRRAGRLVQIYRIKTRDGDIRWVEDHKRASFGDDGTLLGVEGVVFDRTEQKRVEQELRASEAKYRFLFDAVPMGIGISDFEGNILDVNRTTEKMLGYTLDELRSMNVREYYVDPLFRERLVAVLKKKKKLRDQEITFRRKDGGLIHVLMNVDLIEHEGRQVLLATTRDITQRVKTEKALRRSEQLYRTVVESAGETIATISTNGVFLFMNSTGAERLGGKPEDYVGKTMWDIFPNETADRQVAYIRTVAETGKGINTVVPTVLQGRTRWYNTTVEPLRDSDGRISSVLIVARDIHEIRQAQIELDAQKEKMAQAERLASLGTLSATLAHELTQPMTVIALSIEDVLAELDALECPESAKQGLRDCLREVSNVTSIVERFRNFARRSSERQFGMVKLDAVAGRVVQLLNKAAEHARVKLLVKDLDKLPQLRSNEKDLEQMFFALAQNAIQAADGRKPSRLTIKGRQVGRRIELTFTDTCGGIEQAHLEKIFEPFFTTKPPGQGTGLGLCIVQRIAEQNGGKVTVRNRPGKGATFVVRLALDTA